MQGKLGQQGAESIAIQALGFLAADSERLDRFLGETGLEPGDIRRAAGEPGFMLAVLEHLCADESALLTFAANLGAGPEQVDAARQMLASAERADDEWS